MHCMACGQELSDEAIFCSKCGRAVASTAALGAAKPSVMELQCPRCSAKLDVSAETTTCTCTSCGSGLLFAEDGKAVTVSDGGEASHMSGMLEGVRVAALVEEGFERSELVEPQQALEELGAVVEVISPHTDTVRSWEHGNWGEGFKVDVPLASADPDRYDALLLPGGVRNPDRLRRNEDAWRFVRAFFNARKTVAAICHAPWTLIDAGVIDGRRLTSYPSLQTDLKNAGADWVDEGGGCRSGGPRHQPIRPATSRLSTKR